MVASRAVATVPSPAIAVEPPADVPQASIATPPPATSAPIKEKKPFVERAKPAQVVDTHADPAVSTALSTATVAPAPAVTPIAREPLGDSAAAEPTPSSARASEPAVTITGCLEEATDDARFRLSDTEGAAVPKSRGWRSGFLKKRPAPVELIESQDVVTLRKLVGRRVTATGILADRQLRVHSISPAGAPCG
jgi:hypothetical protein